MFSVGAGGGAAEGFEDTVEIADAAKTALVANRIQIHRGVRKQLAGLIKPEHIEQAFEMHTEAPMEEKRKIMVLIV